MSPSINPDMALPTLPVEIVQCNLREIPLETLKLLYIKWPEGDTPRKVLLEIMSEQITFGYMNEESRDVLYSDMLDLHHAATNKVAVRCLKIIDSRGFYAQDLVHINQVHPEFLRQFQELNTKAMLQR